MPKPGSSWLGVPDPMGITLIHCTDTRSAHCTGLATFKAESFKWSSFTSTRRLQLAVSRGSICRFEAQWALRFGNGGCMKNTQEAKWQWDTIARKLLQVTSAAGEHSALPTRALLLHLVSFALSFHTLLRPSAMSSTRVPCLTYASSVQPLFITAHVPQRRVESR